MLLPNKFTVGRRDVRPVAGPLPGALHRGKSPLEAAFESGGVTIATFVTRADDVIEVDEVGLHAGVVPARDRADRARRALQGLAVTGVVRGAVEALGHLQQLLRGAGLQGIGVAHDLCAAHREGTCRQQRGYKEYELGQHDFASGNSNGKAHMKAAARFLFPSGVPAHFSARR